MQVGGASANIVVRSDDPSSAGHGVGPESVAPGATAAGVMPDLANVVTEEATVVVVVDLVELDRVAPKNAPKVESTTTRAMTRARRR